VGDAASMDCSYDLEHPKYGEDVQRLAKTSSQVFTVCFHGSLSDFQDVYGVVILIHSNKK